MDNKNQKIFDCILNTIGKDVNFCNYVKYTDYGHIKKLDSNIYLWETKPCTLNDDQTYNHSQMIRLVDKMDSKFFTNLYNLKYTSHSQNLNTSLTLNEILHIQNTNNVDTYNATLNILQKCSEIITQKSINIAYDIKNKGTSLTFFDFVNKNVKFGYDNLNYYKFVVNEIDKYIFVGNRSYLLAIMDNNGIVYINCHVLNQLQNISDDTLNTCMCRLYALLDKFFIYNTNQNLSQFIGNKIISPIIYDIYKMKMLKNVKGTQNLNMFSNFTFNDDKETDCYIKENIEEIIERYTQNYINRIIDVDHIGIIQIINDTRTAIENLYKDRLKNCFVTGLKLYSLCLEAGWMYCDPRNEPNGVSFNSSHIYIKKEVNFTPKIAFVYSSSLRNRNTSKSTVQRILKEEAVRTFYSDTLIHVDTIYLDVMNGQMLCRGKHPNVSYNNVCMGDIKGKISMSSSNDSEILSMLKKCEELLTTINYTSSYNSGGENYFCEDEYSYTAAGDVNVNENNPLHDAIDIQTVEAGSDDEFSDIIEDEDL